MSFKPIYNIVAKSATEVDILLYGVIGNSWYSDGNTGKKFVQDFKEAEKKYDRINIRINSPGGSVDDGLPMFNVIKASKKDVHTYNDGIAYSMGAMIGLAGKTVHSAKGSLWMLHNVSGGAIGNAKEMRKAADTMDVYDGVLSELIADRTGKTVDQVKKEWMNYDDNFMSASKALDNKLVDVVETYDAADVPENIEDMSHDQIMAYYNPEKETLPEGSLKKLAAKVSKILNLNQNQQNMNLFGSDFPKLNALKGMKPEEITPTVIVDVNAELKAKGMENIVVISSAHFTEANNLADVNAAALTEINALLGAGQEKPNLTEAIAAFKVAATATTTKVTTLTKERDDAVALAKKYGDQPGEKPTTPKPAEGAAPEGGAGTAAVENKFETSVDRELRLRNEKLKNPTS